MNRTIITITGLWLVAAIGLSATGLLARAPMPAPQMLVAVLTGGLLFLVYRLPRLRAWVDSLPIQLLVLVHASRFVGLYFILLYASGQLPGEFAVPAGLGDICVATAAIVLASMPLAGRMGTVVYATWNAFGLLDILFVLITAARMGIMNPDSIAPLTRLPGSLLPTFLVPIIIATHVILIPRLQGSLRANTQKL